MKVLPFSVPILNVKIIFFPFSMRDVPLGYNSLASFEINRENNRE